MKKNKDMKNQIHEKNRRNEKSPLPYDKRHPSQESSDSHLDRLLACASVGSVSIVWIAIADILFNKFRPVLSLCLRRDIQSELLRYQFPYEPRHLLKPIDGLYIVSIRFSLVRFRVFYHFLTVPLRVL